VAAVAEGFSFDAVMHDGMSGPAKSEGEALAKLQSEIKTTEKAIRALQTEQLNYQRGGFKGAAADIGLEIKKLRLPLGDLRSEFHDLKTEQESKAKEGFIGQLKSSLIPEIALGELAAEGIKMLGEATLEVAKSFAEVVIEGTKFAIEMGEFKENAVSAYEAVLGTKEQGEQAFAAIEDLGKSVHLPVERAQGMAQELMEMGLENVGTVSSVLTAVADLNRVGLEKGAAKFQSIVERSLSAGAFVLPKKLSGIGVQLPKLYEDLAARLHKSVPEVKAELKAGKIDVETGIAALTAAVSGGPIGEIAAKKLTFGDITTDIKNDFKGLFEDVDAGPLLRAFDDVRYLIEGADGSTDDFKGTVTSAFNSVIQWTGEAVDAVVEFGLDIEILGLKAEIFWKKHKKGVGTVVDGVETAAGAIARLVPGLDTAINLGHLAKAGFDAAVGGGAPAGAAKPIGVEAPAHAEGGVIARPAAGEFFASVAPGERIVPAGRATDDVAGLSLPDFSGLAMGGGDRIIHPGAVHVEINAPSGTTATKEELQELTEHAMDDVLERLAVELGG
jgi:hypothetical protein